MLHPDRTIEAGDPIQTARRLLACVVSQPANGALIDTIGEHDWPKIVELAIQHKLGALLHARMNQLALGDRIPADARARLDDCARAAGFRSLQIRSEMTGVGRILNEHGLPFIWIKGAHLAHCFYDKPEHREMVDLDLLLQRDSLGQAIREIESRGFRPIQAHVLDADVAAHHHVTPFIRHGVPVELHWNLLADEYSYTCPMDSLWRRSAAVVMDGVAGRVMSTEDLLIHVCLHAAALHYFSLGLRAIADVDAIVGRGVNWPVLWQAAEEWNAVRPLALTLWLAQDLGAALLPGTVVTQLEELVTTAVREIARTRLVIQSIPVSDVVARYAAATDRRGGMLAAARWAVSTVPLAKSRAISPASARRWLYLPHRLVDLARRYAVTAIRWSLGNPSDKRRAQEQHLLRQWLSGGAQS